MPQCTLPKEILFEMEMAGVLPFNQTVGGPVRLENANQTVECTPEMAKWCRQKAKDEIDRQKAEMLLNAAKTIEAALGSN